MTRTNNPIARLLIYLVLALFTVLQRLALRLDDPEFDQAAERRQCQDAAVSSSALPAKTTPTSG